MDLDLSTKRALVTGSTAGIGYAAASQLAAMGAAVSITGRHQSGVDEAVDALRADMPGAEVDGIAADLATADGTAKVTQRLPEVDILVNNVGIFELTPFEDITDADWQRFFDTNVMSGVRLTRHYLKGMLERDWGRIVFVSSESGIHIPPEMIHYGMTKTADMAIARGVAELTAGTSVTCNAVLPGPTRSRGVSAIIEAQAECSGQSIADVERAFIANGRPTSLIRRLASPEEVANMIGYVCSPAASATNGASLRVEGGIVKSLV
ncbi:SDR family NAD(P)-dependent oxidoreductase [Ectothiorhodospiraceae bacterium WFHF3C12]|nr:SDR family NAD(P)-dependent oxidoreductase [Ectothiorhodospiraceae bacterium WFHF3C12]